MSRENLSTDFVNYELATAMGGLRRFTMVENSDGTYSFEDATTYTTTGTTYGADEINTANELINEINELVGTTSISGSGQTDITTLLGGTDISEATLGLGDGTVTGAIYDINSNLTNLNGLHIGTTVGTFPSSEGSNYINFSDLIDNYTSDMAYKVIVLKAISYATGYGIPTEIESSGGSGAVLQNANGTIRLYVGSSASSYYGTQVLIYYAWFD